MVGDIIVSVATGDGPEEEYDPMEVDDAAENDASQDSDDAFEEDGLTAEMTEL